MTMHANKPAPRRLLGTALAVALALGLVNPVPLRAAPQDDAQLQKELADARSRLDDAARDVADLSRKLYGDEAVPMGSPGAPPRGAMLGINIGGGSNRAEGVEVMGVSPAGPAESAGLKAGDVIVAVDGKTLRKTDGQTPSRQLVTHLRSVQPGQKVTVDYLRDGKKLAATVTTSAAEPPMLRALREHMPMLEGMTLPPEVEGMFKHGGRGFRSLELVPLTARLGQYFGTDKGLLVVKAPAATGNAGLEEGDVILTIGGRAPENARHAFRILGSYEPSEKVRVEVLRQRKRVALDIVLPEVGALNPPPRPAARPHAPQPPAPLAPAAPTSGKGSISS